MLKGISPLLSPKLLKTIAAMGHGDELVIGDCNFPADSMNQRCIRCDGLRATEVLDAILQLFPLDTFVEAPVTLMATQPGVLDGDPPVWKEFREIVDKYEGADKKFQQIERFEFYDRARKAYATVATSEQAYYACIIIKKGTLV